MDTLVTKEKAPTNNFLRLNRCQTRILDRATGSKSSKWRDEAQH